MRAAGRILAVIAAGWLLTGAWPAVVHENQGGPDSTGESESKKKVESHKKGSKTAQADPYAEFVWPPAPDKPRIKLVEVISGRADIEVRKRLQKILMGVSPQSEYDQLKKPFAVAFDGEGRILVTDSETKALLRFDRAGRKMDVIGTQGAVRLRHPLGLCVGGDGSIYVADAELRKVVVFNSDGKPTTAYGKEGELANPTDAALSPDGNRLFVADSKAHKIVVFEVKGGNVLKTFGQRGDKEGEFAFPTSLTFGPEGQLFVVDQINSRVQVFAPDGQFLDEFGRLGSGFGNFVRPKDIAVDEVGLIYVADNALNNIQIFGPDFRLLTFVGEGGDGPGRFRGTSGIAVRGDTFAVVEQLGHRLQIFRFIAPKTG